MTESELTQAIIRQIEAIGGKCIKIRGDRWTQRGTPDILACWAGRFIAIEVKVGRNKLSDIQEQRMDEWRLAGAACIEAREDFDIQALISAVKGEGRRVNV